MYQNYQSNGLVIDKSKLVVQDSLLDLNIFSRDHMERKGVD